MLMLRGIEFQNSILYFQMALLHIRLETYGVEFDNRTMKTNNYTNIRTKSLRDSLMVSHSQVKIQGVLLYFGFSQKTSC